MRQALQLLAILVVLAADGMVPVAAEDASVFVKTVPVRRGTLTESITAYGSVVGIPGQTRNISASRAGEIARVVVLPGAEVASGQPLFEFRTDPGATAGHAQAVSAVALARDEVRRTEGLLALKLATESQVAAARKALADAESSLAASTATGAGSKDEVVRAPFRGAVSSIAVESGDRVQAGALLLQLEPLGATRILLAVAPDKAGRVATGSVVGVRPLSPSGPPLKGHVRSVHRVVDKTTGLVGIEVEAEASARQLLIGTTVAGVIGTTAVNAWVVPRAAVLRDSTGAFVFQVLAGQARRIAVNIVGETTTSYAIQASLKTPGTIVTEGNYELSDGMAVREAAAP